MRESSLRHSTFAEYDAPIGSLHLTVAAGRCGSGLIPDCMQLSGAAGDGCAGCADVSAKGEWGMRPPEGEKTVPIEPQPSGSNR